jgi:hypothetical protein
VTIQLNLKDGIYKKLDNIAKTSGKSLQTLASDILQKYSADVERIKNDPMYKMEGYESDAPSDLAANHDHYLYGD